MKSLMATKNIVSVSIMPLVKLEAFDLRQGAICKGCKVPDQRPSWESSVKVIINILDENDNAPRFSQIFSAHVPENSPLGYTVTRVTTSDEDIGVNAISRYSIADTSLPFTINFCTVDIVISTFK